MNNLFSGPIFAFWGTFLGRFSQCNFKIFSSQATIAAYVFTQLQKWSQISSNHKAQHLYSSTYSTYTGHNTVKKLAFCTKSGSISYISDAYAGSTTDRFITEDTNIAGQCTAGFVLFHKILNVQDLLLQYKLTERIPSFVRNIRQILPSEVAVGKRIPR